MCILQFNLDCTLINKLWVHKVTAQGCSLTSILISLQVLFALHDKTLLSGMELDGVTTCNIEPIHTGSSKVDIFLELFEACDGTVVGQIEYDSSLWMRSSIQAMATAFSVSLSWQKL